jgi:hypothetical protein
MLLFAGIVDVNKAFAASANEWKVRFAFDGRQDGSYVPQGTNLEIPYYILSKGAGEGSLVIASDNTVSGTAIGQADMSGAISLGTEDCKGQTSYNATFKVKGTYDPVTRIAAITLLDSIPSSIPITVNCQTYSFPYYLASPFDTCNQTIGLLLQNGNTPLIPFRGTKEQCDGVTVTSSWRATLTGPEGKCVITISSSADRLEVIEGKSVSTKILFKTTTGTNPGPLKIDVKSDPSLKSSYKLTVSKGLAKGTQSVDLSINTKPDAAKDPIIKQTQYSLLISAQANNCENPSLLFIALVVNPAQATITTSTGNSRLDLICSNQSEFTAVKVDYGKSAKKGAMTNYSTLILQSILHDAGISKATISSTSRTADDQARIMYDNIVKYGIKNQTDLYASSGDQVIKVFADHKKDYKIGNKISDTEKAKIIAAMKAKITTLGADRVSHHASDPAKLGVFDIPPSSVSDKKAFEKSLEQANKDGLIRFIGPNQKDPAYHLEIPQPSPEKLPSCLK